MLLYGFVLAYIVQHIFDGHIPCRMIQSHSMGKHISPTTRNRTTANAKISFPWKLHNILAPMPLPLSRLSSSSYFSIISNHSLIPPPPFPISNQFSPSISLSFSAIFSPLHNSPVSLSLSLTRLLAYSLLLPPHALSSLHSLQCFLSANMHA